MGCIDALKSCFYNNKMLKITPKVFGVKIVTCLLKRETFGVNLEGLESHYEIKGSKCV